MNGTPRLRSAFPQTPQTAPRFRDHSARTPTRPQLHNAAVQKLPAKVLTGSSDAKSPLIPAGVIDAPSQRLYVAAFYLALNTWRVYDSWSASDDLDSTWLFLKWAAVDGVFLFGLQALRIPWLEWAFPTTLAIFLIHVAGNIFLMFQIPIPVGAWIAGAIKLAYDRELSISERSVKPGDIIHNASLILGKQIVHILPEGSAILNPDHIPLCIGTSRTAVDLPIRVNQTDPILIELLRLDYDSGENETISIPAKQLKNMKRQADRSLPKTRSSLHRDLIFPVKRPGIYRLQRVVDESNLDVHMRSSDALVAACPRATIKDSPTHKCRGELSNLVLVVEGTPPLKIKYSRQVNNLDRGFSFHNIQPDQLRSPLLGQQTSGTLFNAKESDVTWARSQSIEVPLNESLNVGGEWIYTIEEVHDGSGNIANYSILLDVERLSTKSSSQWHEFSVHERPRLSLSGCNDQSFLEVAQGASVDLPLNYHQSGQGYGNDGPFSLVYTFNGEAQPGHADLPSKIRQASLSNLDQKPQIKDPGWYRLNSLSSQYCSGEVLEPSSCYLRNPPEPDMTVKYERIFDKCANNPVGLLVDLDLTGSPPFRLRYVIEHAKGVETRAQSIDGLRAQLDFTPPEAGLYRYRFLDIADTVYGPQSLQDKVPVLEQDVKPPASAHFLGPKVVRKACFGEPVSVDVAFLGEAPWTMQYEVVHNGKKTKYTLDSDSEISTIVTERLVSGGEYLVLLTSVKDRSNCKRALKDSIRIDARSKPPHVAFGEIERSRRYSALQDSNVDLPIRLSGERPWNVKYKNVNASSAVYEKTFWHENSFLNVAQDGQYELVGVADSSCPGFVDQEGSVFEVSWIPRPRITTVDGSPVGSDGRIMKRDVCQGDDDSLEVRLSGNAPYSIQYEQQRKPLRGSSSVRVQSLRTALNAASLEMDTSEAGLYTYKFTEVGDNLYDQDPGVKPVVVTQKVNPLPSARFDSPGRIYGFCKEDVSGEELIPITLEGVTPFSLEISIKHHSKAKPEVVTISNINANRHHLPLPRRHLDLGQHVVSIRKVTDARGCQQTTEYDSSSVRVAVSDVPTIIPLESKSDYCVGERLSFSLSGHAPFDVFYTFDGASRKATSKTTTFRRIAEKPGVFSITAVSDGASGRCKAHKSITKTIHEMPSVRISKGQVSVVDIHEGGEAELQFEFWGTPPFEFTYVRSSNARKGKKSEILDVKHDVSHEHTKTIKTSDEGTYEVVAIKDKYCSFSSHIPAGKTERVMA
ncbi:putative nuclear envelope pore membrane protein [Aspergillus homomorphus CBS 101889]|uniref:Nuclear envelope pore membrane protein n=1 Tax=Aspergillus homomorphus (strain CBS 101889) TaxID=1450537 RepID=A0A395HKY2_ASPHC|nr:nuclear envelope pore membrane protein [Aspergillus homomorphus CBS 101889]RAL08420.1 nuclear envelope pore membrane protein [Aspergillus homomorphus CBS 101889]